jgi:hypothetical protein
MAHKKKDTSNKEKLSYTFEDAMKIADEILKFGKEKNCNLGAFVHGIIFALEYTEHAYKIPPQQTANIKRDCRKYFKEIENMQKQSTTL